MPHDYLIDFTRKSGKCRRPFQRALDKIFQCVCSNPAIRAHDPEGLGARCAPDVREVIWCICPMCVLLSQRLGMPRMQTPQASSPPLISASCRHCLTSPAAGTLRFGQPSVGRAQGQGGKCSAVPGPPRGHPWLLTGPRGVYLPHIGPLSFTVILTMTAASACPYICLILARPLLLPGTTYHVNHLHPSPLSGSAFGEPNLRQPSNDTH